MQRLINLCVLPSLGLSMFFAVMIVQLPSVDAQTSTNCLGENRCEKWNNMSGSVITAQCVTLSCSQSRNLTSCNVQRCRQIPSSCGAGSFWETQSFVCNATPETANQSASTSFFCASENESRLISVLGPGKCGAASFTSMYPKYITITENTTAELTVVIRKNRADLSARRLRSSILLSM